MLCLVGRFALVSFRLSPFFSCMLGGAFGGFAPSLFLPLFLLFFHKHKLKAFGGFWFSQVAFLVFGPLTNQTKLLFIR